MMIDCSKCAGLCCVALYCFKRDGFPEDKDAGVPCRYLMEDFRCQIHDDLRDKGLKGCMAYDCFGAGQWVTDRFGSRGNWKEKPEIAEEMFRTFHIIFQLHQMRWFLLEALALTETKETKNEIRKLILENKSMADLSPEKIRRLDLDTYRCRVNPILKDVIRRKAERFSKGSDSRDFTMAILIGTNFSGRTLGESLFLGSDLRDANLAGTDLSECHFLTQMQINSAKGDSYTKLPKGIKMPEHWVRI